MNKNGAAVVHQRVEPSGAGTLLAGRTLASARLAAAASAPVILSSPVPDSDEPTLTLYVLVIVNAGHESLIAAPDAVVAQPEPEIFIVRPASGYGGTSSSGLFVATLPAVAVTLGLAMPAPTLLI